MAKARAIATQFPRLRVRLNTTAAAHYAASPENSFEFGLRALLDGLEAQLSARRTPADQNARQPRRRTNRRNQPSITGSPPSDSGRRPREGCRRGGRHDEADLRTI